MNDLDKTISTEETATSLPAEETAAASVIDSIDSANKTDVNEDYADAATDFKHQTTEPIAEISTVDNEHRREEIAEEEDLRIFYAMDKRQLIESLTKIVDNSLADRHKAVNAIKQAFYNIRKTELEEEAARFIEEGNDQSTFSSEPSSDEILFKDLLNRFREIRSAFLEQEEERKATNLSFKLRILEQMRSLIEDIDNINLHTSKFRQLEQEFKNITDIPASSVTDTWRQFTLLVDQFYDSRKMNIELRDLDFKKNLEIKNRLILQAEKLSEETDVIKAFKTLQDLHDQWRTIGPVAKEIREELWARFKEASTVVNKRHQDFFEERKAQEKENEERKTALCEEIEAIDLDSLNSFSAWDEATKTILSLQARWKELGFASKKVNNQLFSRFRKSCDDFFTQKAQYFKKTKDEFASNLEKKIALCEQVEALLNREDVKGATEKIVALQKEWKTIGSVARKRSDEVWNRFTTACNQFFDAKKKASAEVRKEENANLDAKREIIEALKAIPADTDRQESIKMLRNLQQKWNSIGHVPYKMKDKIYDEYRSLADALYSRLDVNENRSRMNDFVDKIDEMNGDSNRLGRERDRLVRALENRRNELKTYENNLGFFNIKSQAGNSMLKEMQRKMERIKADMEEIQTKINLIDSKVD